MDWPEVAAEVARGIAPKIHEGVINGAVVVIVLTGAGSILLKFREKLRLSPGMDTASIQRQLDALAKRDEELTRKLEQIDSRTADTSVKVAEMHGAVMAMVRIRTN